MFSNLNNTFLSNLRLLISFVFIAILSLILSPFSGIAQEVDYRTLIGNAQTPRERVLHVLDYAEKMKSIDPQGVHDALNEVRKDINEINDDYLRVKSFVFYAMVFQRLSKPDSAKMYLDKADVLLDQFEDPDLHFKYNNAFGRYHHEQQAFDSAFYYYQHCLAIALQTNDTLYLAGVYNNLGILYDSRSEFYEAYEHYMKALTFFKAVHETGHVAITLNNLGLIMKKLNEHNKAIDFFQQAIEINTELNSRFNLSMNYGNIGTIYQELELYDEAIEAHQQSLKISVEDDNVRDQARAYHNIGNIYSNQKKWKDAEYNFQYSLEICRNHQIFYGVMLNQLALASNYLAQKKSQLALAHADTAYKIAANSGDISIQTDALKLKSDIMELMGRSEEALKLLQQFNLLNDSLTALTNKNYILDLQERYETDKKELENQRLIIENESKSKTIKLQNNVNYLITLISLLLIGMVIIIIRNSRKVKKYSKTLEKVNEKMKNQNIRLQELNETKDKLFSIVGHDLKSPFNSLIGFLEMLTSNYEILEPHEQKEILQKLFEESNQTHALLENMLQWAMSQRGQIDFNPVICNLKEVAFEEIFFLETRANKKKIKIVNLIDDEATLEADMNMLQIIIRNIVNNAIKFTSSNGLVTLSNEMHYNGITLIIKDNGKGIPADVIPKLTNETSYYSTTGTGNEKGTGLGLMIVKDFLKKHHARLTIESELEKGSVFRIFFPKTIS